MYFCAYAQKEDVRGLKAPNTCTEPLLSLSTVLESWSFWRKAPNLRVTLLNVLHIKSPQLLLSSAWHYFFSQTVPFL